MSSRPRNPRYFPDMKVRGARRNRNALFQRVMWVFDEMGTISLEVSKLFAAWSWIHNEGGTK